MIPAWPLLKQARCSWTRHSLRMNGQLEILHPPKPGIAIKCRIFLQSILDEGKCTS